MVESPFAGSRGLALVIEHAMRRGMVAMILERMGFERFAGPMPRGGVTAFDDAYRRPGQASRDRLRQRHGTAQAALFARSRRAEAAAFNRGLAAHPVLLLARDRGPAAAVWFDTVSGAWRDAAGGAGGEDIVTLGAVMWQCRIGQAAWRCARLADLQWPSRFTPSGVSALRRSDRSTHALRR